MNIYVIDIETTGLDGFPKDLVVEIAIMRANLLKKQVDQVYHSLIHYDTTEWDDSIRNAWIFEKGVLSLEDVQNAEKDLPTVVEEVRKILSNQHIAAYNNAFDFDKFLKQEPWNINLLDSNTKIAPCIMVTATDYLKTLGKKPRNVFFNLAYSKRNLLRGSSQSIQINKELEDKISEYGAHRANYDAFYSACMLIELYELNNYNFIPQIYYSHSMNIYGTKLEKRELKLIKNTFPKADIINPSKYEKKWKGVSSKEIMQQCLDLLSKSDIVVFSAIKYGEEYFVGRGVYVEVKFAEELGKEVYFLKNELENLYLLDVYDDTDWTSKFGKVEDKK